MSGTEGLSLYTSDSRILWDDHIKQLLGVPGGESRHGVCEIGRAGHDVLKLLIETTSGLGLTERQIRWPVVHTGLNECVAGEWPLRDVVIDLEILLIAPGERGEGGLIAVRPFLVLVDGAMKSPAV
jgi:hypothetical protein